jgi:hypothetical protein
MSKIDSNKFLISSDYKSAASVERLVENNHTQQLKHLYQIKKI